MKVIILAGGYGSRLSEYTDSIPKPMVPVGNRPILWHIMRLYARFLHSDFYLALGYKSEVIKDYFLNYRLLNSDFTIDLSTGNVLPKQLDSVEWKVTLIDTGLDTMTGGRVKRMKSYIGNETFMLTYGDAVANIDLDALVAFHRSHKKMVTVTAVRPAGRFGELKIDDGKVLSFKEKPQLHDGWVSGGFFVINPEFFEVIGGDDTSLEREPLESIANAGELMAYQHKGFWHCMDTKRDRDLLQSLWETGAPWKF